MAQLVKNKESTCKVGDLGSIPGVGRSLEKGMATQSIFWPEEFHGQRSLEGYSPHSQLQRIGHDSALGFPGGSDSKQSACGVADPGSIPGKGKTPGEGNGNPFRYSCLENPMVGRARQATAHGVSKSQT